MEVGIMQSDAYASQAHRARAAELIIDPNEIKSILYLGLKGINKMAVQAEEFEDSNHTVDTFV